MFCRNCGNQIPDGTAACPNCGQAVTEPVAPQTVESHLVFAILTTIFCCLPFGVVAIVYAAQVSSLVSCGNIAAAQQASEKANKWAMASLICGLAGVLIYVLLYVVGGVAAIACN